MFPAGVFQTQIQAVPNTDAIKQAAWDAIAAIPDYGHSVIQATSGQGGVYKDTTITNRCASGDEVLGLKAFGNNKPTPANLIFAGSVALTPTNALVWWKDNGNVVSLAPIYKDDGNWDRYVRFINGPPNTQYLESNPGAFGTKNQPVDMYMCLRWIPQTSDEGMGGIKSLTVTNTTDKLSFIDSYTPDVTLASGVSYNKYVDTLMRIQVTAGNAWQVWINGVSVGTGTGVVFATTEEWWGTNSHVLGMHMRYRMWKYGAFTPTEVTTIENNTQLIWPWNKKPNFPFISEIYYGDASTWDNTIKSWRAGRGQTTVFSGGNGTAGAHKYVWYYFDSGDATLFPSADGILTNHRQVPCSVNISTMASGNSVTQISIDGVNLMSTSVTWNTNLATTGAAIVSNINAFQTAYLAQLRTGTILFHPQGLGCNAYHTNAVTITASGFSPTKIDAPRSQDLVRTTYAGANQIFFGHAGDNTLSVGCVTYPFDSVGTPGDPIATRWIHDNIP